MKRVVITGMGVVSSLGNDLNTFWDNIKNGRSGAKPISRFNAEKFKTQFAAQLPDDFNALQYLDRNEIKRNDLYTQYALIAAKQAIQDSGFDISTMSPYDVGVIFGSAQGGMQTFEEQVEEYAAKGEPHFNPFFIPKTLVNMAAGLISIKYGLMGVNFTTVSACASANSAIMDALNYIRWGKAKIIVTGGADAPITQASMGGYNALKALSTRNSDPQAASRPFDVERDGFMMGEGAGVLVLEEYEHAKQRGATIYAEVAGAAMTGDAYHITATHPEGKGAIKAMELALLDAGVNHSEVDYLNAHATSTPVGDLSEAKAIYSAFGDSERLSVSATKSMTGHLLGAAGAIEAIISAKAVLNGIVPPTINTQQLDPQIPQGLNIVTGQAQEKPVHVALSNTFGFGGHNSVVVFKKI